jgi:hypothetical protein
MGCNFCELSAAYTSCVWISEAQQCHFQKCIVHLLLNINEHYLTSQFYLASQADFSPPGKSVVLCLIKHFTGSVNDKETCMLIFGVE